MTLDAKALEAAKQRIWQHENLDIEDIADYAIRFYLEALPHAGKVSEGEPDWKHAFAAQSRKLEAVLHLPGVKEAIRSLDWSNWPPFPADAGEPKPFATAYRWKIDGEWTSWQVAIGDITHAKSRAEYEEKALYDVALVPATSQAKGGSGVAAIAAERQRQIGAEGWTPEHDDEAAASYAEFASYSDAQRADHERERYLPANWFWSDEWWKPTDRRRDLVKAGALIAAEIDRLDRQVLRTSAPVGQTAKEGGE